MSRTSDQLTEMQQQALALLQAGQLEQAEKLYRQAIGREPSEPMAYVHLSSALLGQGKLRQAIESLEEGRCHHPKSVDILAALGAILANQGGIVQGRELLEQAISCRPDSAVAHYGLAGVLLQGGMIEQALGACQAGVELNPSSAEGQFLLGTILIAARQSNQAIEAFEECIRLAPQWLPAYMNLGSILAESGRYDEALCIYQQAQALQPEYVDTYKNLGMLLHVTGRLDEAECQLRMALQKDHSDATALMLMGNVLRDMGRLTEAGEYYQNALRYDPSMSAAEENLRRITTSRIPHWHFDMLADSARNDAFNRALCNAVSEQSKVLDIGTGSGLLAMMAARAGAQQVFACEMVPELANVAQQVVQDNELQERIEVICAKSTTLKVGEQLPEPADLLVAEILDAGLLGEGVLPTLRHAKSNLIKPDAAIIPQAAEVQGVLIESDSLRRVNPIGMISGFDLRAFNAFKEVNAYQTIQLSLTEHRRLTETFAIHAIDFRELPPPVANSAPHSWELQVRAMQAGTVHGIAFWFFLQLDDENRISSAPEGEMMHWGQAVQFFPEAISVHEGQQLQVRVHQYETRYEFELLA